MNYASANEHVPREDRNNRTIQERIRVNYHYLPCDHLPRTLVKYMGSKAPRKLNYFPAKHGVSKQCSPKMILHKENIGFERHCKYTLEEYVQLHEDKSIKNTNAPILLDCLYLRPTSNNQGGHEMLYLQTNRVITRNNVTSATTTPSIVNQVNEIAKSGGI